MLATAITPYLQHVVLFMYSNFITFHFASSMEVYFIAVLKLCRWAYDQLCLPSIQIIFFFSIFITVEIYCQ